MRAILQLTEWSSAMQQLDSYSLDKQSEGTKQAIKEYTHHNDLEDIIVYKVSQNSQDCVSIKNTLLLSYFGIC